MTTIQEIYAFAGSKLVATGTAAQLLGEHKSALEQRAGSGLVLFFNSNTGRQVDIDVPSEAIRDQSQHAGPSDTGRESKLLQKKSRGRPRLGVVGREVTLLPRVWEWLDQQRAVLLRHCGDSSMKIARSVQRRMLFAKPRTVPIVL